MNVFRLVRHQHWPIFYQVLPHPPYLHIGSNDTKLLPQPIVPIHTEKNYFKKNTEFII